MRGAKPCPAPRMTELLSSGEAGVLELHGIAQRMHDQILHVAALQVGKALEVQGGDDRIGVHQELLASSRLCRRVSELASALAEVIRSV